MKFKVGDRVNGNKYFLTAFRFSNLYDRVFVIEEVLADGNVVLSEGSDPMGDGDRVWSTHWLTKVSRVKLLSVRRIK